MKVLLVAPRLEAVLPTTRDLSPVKKTLLVAPKTDLLMVPAEVQDVVNSGLQPELLQGDVSSVDLQRKLSARYDVLWLATHGTENGIMLSDGLMSAATLAQLVRDRVQLVYLNTCKSYGVALVLQNETNATIVCTVKDAPDNEAYHTGSLFAKALAETGNYQAAYERSKPGNNSTYLFLAGKKQMSRQFDQTERQLNGNAGDERTPREREAENVRRRRFTTLGDLAEGQERLIDLIDGNEDLGVIGMRVRVREIYNRTSVMMVVLVATDVLLFGVIIGMFMLFWR